MATFLFILGIVLFILLIVVHELGHAIVAKRNGVVVEEFGIGFPPRAWKKKLKNGVLFTLNWLPLGGFVKLQGESDDSNKKGDYGRASLWAKTKILLAGVAMNWLVAVVLFTGLALVGIPKFLPNQFSVPFDSHGESYPVLVDSVAEDTPAAELGLEADDEIVSFAGQSIEMGAGLLQLTKENAGQTVPITYRSDGETVTEQVTLLGEDSDRGQLGVGIYQTGAPTVRATWAAPLVGIGTTAQFTWETLKGLGAALGNLGLGVVQLLSFDAETREAGRENTAEAGANVGGPIFIVSFLMQIAENAGLVGILSIIAILSLTLALFNALPIPALDGGRLFVTLLFRGLKKPLTREREEKIHATGFLALIGLIVLVTIVDINRLTG